MKKFTFLIVLLIAGFLFCTESKAQDYKTGIGLRLGQAPGLTVKHFVNNKGALEGIISPLWRGVLITGLYEVHGNAFDARGLNWYGGIGGHVGFWNYNDRYYKGHPWFDPNYPSRSYTVVGMDLIIGLEYTFKEIPINLGVDWKPAINFNTDHAFWGGDLALSVRFLPGNL